MLLFLLGCAWISEAEWQARIDALPCQGCGDSGVGDETGLPDDSAADVDGDGDGVTPSGGDCDDGDAARHPGAAETWYDGLDQDCDGNDGDQDGDGSYATDYPGDVPDGYTAGDCWDDPAEASTALNGFPQPTAADVHPGAEETWYDGIDGDCARDSDFDADGDEHATNVWPDSQGSIGGDCDDADPQAWPGAEELWYDDVDQDCAGGDDFDQDHDGYSLGDDCEDTDPATHPDAFEACDGVDSDCDGTDNDPDAMGCAPWYADADGDGFGDRTDGMCLCGAEGLHTASQPTDCDDGDAAVSPGLAERCDTPGVDDDCDAYVDEVGADGCVDWFYDGDNDGYGTPVSQCACAASGNYDAATDDDCDDARRTVNPGATETCNDTDDDCDSAIDDGLTLYYTDADGDGYGAGAGDCGNGGVTDDGDCDDADDITYPGADEVCDGVDNDCDASTGEDGVVSWTDGTSWADLTSAWTSATTTVALPSTGTVYVCAGTYPVRLVGTSSSAGVVGLEGASNTTLDAGGAGSVVSITGGSVSIEGLTITGGIGSSSGADRYGGGVIVTSTSASASPHLTLVDCVVTGNTATHGGGVAAHLYGSIALEGTLVHGNTASDGGGLWIDRGDVTCADSASGAGGLYDNVASDDGGGAYLSNTVAGTLWSEACDWGTSAAGDDNSPDDVNLAGTAPYTSYGADATFGCDATSCM